MIKNINTQTAKKRDKTKFTLPTSIGDDQNTQNPHPYLSPTLKELTMYFTVFFYLTPYIPIFVLTTLSSLSPQP